MFIPSSEVDLHGALVEIVLYRQLSERRSTDFDPEKARAWLLHYLIARKVQAADALGVRNTRSRPRPVVTPDERRLAATTALDAPTDPKALRGFLLDAWESLRDALACGRIAASVRSAESGRSHPIASRFWTSDAADDVHATAWFEMVIGMGVMRGPILFTRDSITGIFGSLSSKELRIEPVETEVLAPARTRRGRKPKYDQEQFVSQVVEKLKDEGGLAPANGSNFIQSLLEAYMRDWCDNNWDETPQESQLRAFVVKGIERYEVENSSR